MPFNSKTQKMTDIEKKLARGFIMDYSKGAIWKGIQIFKSECKKEVPDISNEQFIDLVKEQYGIKLTFVNSTIHTGFDSNYEIVDEQKYVLFALKYAK